MIFVDTGAWIARFYPADQHHAVARQWFAQNQQPLLTTDYIVDETLTVLKARGEPARALQLGALFFTGQLTRLYYLTEGDVLSAWQIFRQYTDKDWSFTDCTSKLVLERLAIAQACSFDQHFRQFGTVTVVP
jgi:predicted nucleic acid-binding protein